LRHLPPLRHVLAASCGSFTKLRSSGLRVGDRDMHPAIRPTLEHLGRRSRTAEAAEGLAAGRATGARSGAGEPVFTHQAEPPGHSVPAFPPSRESARTRAHKKRPMLGVHCMGLGPFAGCPPLTCGDALEPHFSSRVGRGSNAGGSGSVAGVPPLGIFSAGRAPRA
jgi:hypothetical protein